MDTDATKKLHEPAKCEIRPREAVFRQWDEDKGYFAHVPTTMHEVFVDGEPEAVAASDNLKVAEIIVGMLSGVALQDVPAVLKAISSPALTRSYAMRREPVLHQPQYPFERHSIA